MAVWGSMKIVPVGIFSLLMLQSPERMRTAILEKLPAIGTLITLISSLGGMIPVLQEYFWTGNRLAGTLQYPNTFALFLLICLLYLLHQKELRSGNIAQAMVLAAGILLTGSRTVFLMLPMLLLVSAVMVEEKRRRALCVGITAAIGAAVICFLAVKGDNAYPRLLEISSSESSLLGRVLYWKDTLSVIVEHPLGLGYLGYYFTQGSFQTGVYAVNHVHNEFLQIFLDIGWLAGSGFIGMWIYGMRKAVCGLHRLLLLTMGLHALVDFDLQYIAVYMIFLALLPWECGQSRIIPVKRIERVTIISVGLSLFLCYFAVGAAAWHFQWQSIANRFYPQNTFLQIEELKAAQDADEMEKKAEQILSHNSSVALAWDAKARTSFSRGDVRKMIECKQRAIALSRYTLGEYLDYLDMLFAAAEWYSQAGDQESAQYCLREAVRVPKQLDIVKEETDTLGWRIQDKPALDLPASYQSYLKEIQMQ
ncbi:O-antigen ligase family protein [Ihubacter sp. mB4P-1]